MLENSQGNLRFILVYCKPTVYRPHIYYKQTSPQQRFNKVGSCRAQPINFPKTEFTLDLTVEKLEILMYSLKTVLGESFFSAKMQV